MTASRPNNKRLGRTLGELPRLAFRKILYRRDELGVFEVRAGAVIAPPSSPGLQILLLSGPAIEEVAGTSPFLTAEDMARFRHQRATCIVARDGNRTVASSWMLGGTTYVTELHRTIEVSDSEHFSCRSYVHPTHQGRALLGHLIASYAACLPAGDRIFGFVYKWNEASIRSLDRIGWEYVGDTWTTHVLGVKLHGSRARPPRRALMAAR